MGAAIAAHADWSVDAGKRWMAVARRSGAGWVLAAPVPVGEVGSLCARLRDAAGGGAVALGVDFPLGLPRGYVARCGLEGGFPGFLRGLAGRPAFFSVCATLAEVAPGRPFYPARGVRGMTRAGHAAALGLEGVAGLSRRCDRATAERPAGAPLFWTLGANQTGKAAISAWRDWLGPILERGRAPRLWPFEGDFCGLLAPGEVAVAETYPAEALRHLGLRLVGSKRRQGDRRVLDDLVRHRGITGPRSQLHHVLHKLRGADPMKQVSAVEFRWPRSQDAESCRRDTRCVIRRDVCNCIEVWSYC